MEKLQSYFKRYPASQEVYENGGQLFHNRGAADSYGRSETKKYTRKDVEKQTAGGEQQVAGSELTKEDAIAKLKATADISALSYEDMKAYVKVLELKPETNSKGNNLYSLHPAS